MPVDLSTFREAAVTTVHSACHLCRNVQAGLVKADSLDKKDRSPVTIADFGAQAIVIDALTRALPDVPIVAEEDAAALRGDHASAIRKRVFDQVRRVSADLNEAQMLDAIDAGGCPGGATGRFWALDPIDGTKGFLRGQQYAIALGLIEDGAVVLGVLGCPNLAVDPTGANDASGCLFVAARGQGTVQIDLDTGETRTVYVRPVDSTADAILCESVEKGHTRHDESAQVAAMLGLSNHPFRIDSQCKYAAVARGQCDVYLRLPTRADYHECIWDHAAGSIVVTEAGGRVSDIDGNPLDFSRGRRLTSNRGVITTNGRLHEQVLSAVTEVLHNQRGSS